VVARVIIMPRMCELIWFQNLLHHCLYVTSHVFTFRISAGLGFSLIICRFITVASSFSCLGKTFVLSCMYLFKYIVYPVLMFLSFCRDIRILCVANKYSLRLSLTFIFFYFYISLLALLLSI
jgi:hypothetical protein